MSRNVAVNAEIVLVFIYIQEYKLQKDHKMSSMERWKTKKHKYWN